MLRQGFCFWYLLTLDKSNILLLKFLSLVFERWARRLRHGQVHDQRTSCLPLPYDFLFSLFFSAVYKISHTEYPT